MNAQTIVSLVGVLLTFAAAGVTVLGGRRINQANADAVTRTMSLTEMEKALTFQGSQLDSLRDQVMELQRAHQRCEDDKVLLHRELAELRGML